MSSPYSETLWELTLKEQQKTVNKYVVRMKKAFTSLGWIAVHPVLTALGYQRFVCTEGRVQLANESKKSR